MSAGTVHRRLEAEATWLRLELDAPPGHVLSRVLVQELRSALAEAGGLPRLRWVTIEGRGGQFSYGASIPEHLPAVIRDVLPEMHALMRALLDLPCPTAAIVEGRCLGGGFELALCCDDIIAAESAEFGLPEIRLGAFPPLAAALLPIRVGASRATRAVVTGDTQPAGYWHAAGLVSIVAEATPPLDAARRWFERQLAPHSPAALGHAVLAARTVWRGAVDHAIAENERRYLERLVEHPDAEEGVRAWLEKRPPVWRDR